MFSLFKDVPRQRILLETHCNIRINADTYLRRFFRIEISRETISLKLSLSLSVSLTSFEGHRRAI